MLDLRLAIQAFFPSNYHPQEVCNNIFTSLVYQTVFIMVAFARGGLGEICFDKLVNPSLEVFHRFSSILFLLSSLALSCTSIIKRNIIKLLRSNK
jgi:cation transport ATPase